MKVMLIPITAYLYGKENYTKDGPKRIHEEIEAESELQAKREMFNKWRKRGWWIFSLQSGPESKV